ncbi:GNAT family N-acetyltransferase [Halobacillus litoralis]|uniref:GNAT family N-acetyltransferase n=1 Tax=Halobacillus litoralis TaxID=45668 RepID=A0A845DM57_9BACI|nr:GNAT family N-acetyltransferase [Halobacillus litoralis]MYL18338.1 GNAT family N-acetyltransferase [Halobacillus litoralis]MYL38672.1 GNAT family N-acetyltransferase [Halobacillus litoralis]
METRELNRSDAEACYELRLEALLTNPDAFITTYEQEKQRPNPIETTAERLESKDTRTFGLFSEEELAGVVTLMRETHPKFRHKASIVAMYVTPEVRRKGGAQQLLKELIQHAAAVEIEVLHLSVVTENTPARELYQKLGFQCWGVEKKAIKLPGRYLNEEHYELFL